MYKLLHANQSAVTESKLIDASTEPMDYKQDRKLQGMMDKFIILVEYFYVKTH